MDIGPPSTGLPRRPEAAGPTPPAEALEKPPPERPAAPARPAEPPREEAARHAPRRGGERRRRLRLAGLAALALLLLAAGGAWLHRLLTHVVVDDARIAADMIGLSSRVPGWVREVRVIAGDRAAAGEVVVRLDDREAALALQELEARLAGIAARRREIEARLAMVEALTASREAAERARLETARAALPAAEAERAFAEAEFRRAQELAAGGSGTRQRLDQTRAALEAAHHRVLGARAEIGAAEAELAAAGAARAEREVLRRQLEALGPEERELAARRDRAALDLADRAIAMPVDGIVNRVFVDAGEYVAPGQRILLLHDPARVRVEANVKETQIRHFSPGTRVRVRVDAWPGRRFEGVVERMAGAATSEFALLPSPNPSGNFTKIAQRLPVRIALDPPPEPGLLSPGMMVVVETPRRE
ncbi:HlyD family secretion protein [Crenalkalicoccus roseus]|uniref:HlyD family secretion protein n=1 Tax=Crenalkalicoccus roseus TaxID=1485588 RepID=UPI0010802688|nr:HlyD family secretion protein [Crenalkalicoccus roseus]